MVPESVTHRRAMGAFAPTAVVVAAVLGYILVAGKGILLPFVCALFLWTLLTGLADAIRRIPRRFVPVELPYLVRLGLAIAAVSGLLWVVGRLITQNARKVAAAAPRYFGGLERLLDDALSKLGLEDIRVGELIGGADLGQTLSLLSGTFDIAGKTGSILLYTLLYALFLLLEGHTFPEKVRALVPEPERQRNTQQTLERIGFQVQKYLAIKTLTSAIVGTLTFGVLVVLRVEFAGFWGVLTFVLNYIPYIGSFFAVLFPASMSLLQSGSVANFLFTFGLLLCAQFFVGNILEPRIMGRSLNLSPLVILLSLTVWGALWGVVGMFLGVPIMVTAMIVMAQFERTRPIAILLSERGRIAASEPR
jgi:AI-2 transport protein TqsA